MKKTTKEIYYELFFNSYSGSQTHKAPTLKLIKMKFEELSPWFPVSKISKVTVTTTREEISL